MASEILTSEPILNKIASISQLPVITEIAMLTIKSKIMLFFFFPNTILKDVHSGLYGKSNHDGEVKDARGVQSGLHCDACVQFILCVRRQMIGSV